LRTYQTIPVVADRRGAQADPLDRADGVAEVHVVADAVLVLEQHEDPGQEVLDEVLRAEADGETEHARPREHRREVHAEPAEHHRERRPEYQDRGGVADHRPDGARPLGTAGGAAEGQDAVGLADATPASQQRQQAGDARAGGHVADDAVDDEAQHDGDHDDERGAHAGVDEPVEGRGRGEHPFGATARRVAARGR
jgi:hypothetical protein